MHGAMGRKRDERDVTDACFGICKKDVSSHTRNVGERMLETTMSLSSESSPAYAVSPLSFQKVVQKVALKFGGNGIKALPLQPNTQA